MKSSQIDEISKLADKIWLNDVYFKLINKFTDIFQMEIKEKFKIVIEKIDIEAEKIKTNINNISSVFKEVKEKLSDKSIPENVSNESFLPFKKYMEEQNKKVEKIKEIRDEIYKIYIQITTSVKPETNINAKDN